MSTDAKEQAPATSKRRRRRIPSDLERMAKKVNEMRIANSDERLVIVNTICNVETNEALSKFMTIDGHVLLATWLNQALTQGHIALQNALLKLAARLPISGNMSTAIEATVSELALKCQNNEVRDLAKAALFQWQNGRPDPRHFSITIGDNERKVVFERDPNYYSSSGDDEEEGPTPKRSRINRKTLQWAPEHRLEMVRVFHSLPEEKQSSGSASASSSRSKPQLITAQTAWLCPPIVVIPENCTFRESGSQSSEAKLQANRSAGLMEVAYFKDEHIPLNPAPPPAEPSSNTTPYTTDLTNLPPPVNGMKSGPLTDDVLGLDSHESALALDELISAGVDDLLESNEFNLEPEAFGFGRIRSPPPAVRRDRPRSPPPVDLNIDNYGLPLPPQSSPPPRPDWHYAPMQRPPPYYPPPERPPFDGYGRPAAYREHPPYPYEPEQRRRSPPRPLPPYPPPPRPGPYNDFNGPVPHGRYDEYRGYPPPDHRFPPNRFAERPNEFRDRPPSPFRGGGDLYPPRPFDDRRGGAGGGGSTGRLCKFYQMPRGCSLGDSCSFVHESPTAMKGPPSGAPVPRSRPRPRGKGRGQPQQQQGLANEVPKAVETAAEPEGELDQFGRLRKGATPPPAPQ